MSLLTELRRRNVIRVAVAYLVLCWLVLQTVDVLSGVLGLSDSLIRLVAIIAAIGLFPVMIFSWVYELTPEGLKREHEVNRSQSIVRETGRRLELATIGVIVLAVGLLVVDRFIIEAPVEVATGTDPGPPALPDDGRASIAVLPFVNLSGNADNEYFSDGLSETLMHMLAQVEELRVAARTSSFSYKNRNVDVREIAGALGVGTLLEGSVQRTGDRVRITAQLIDGRDGAHLWSESFDRDLDDIFAIQDEIADTVASALLKSLLGEVDTQSPDQLNLLTTDSTEAFDLYLRGLEKLNQATYTSLPEAETLLSSAIAIDPGFDEARIALARTYDGMRTTGLIGWGGEAAGIRSALGPIMERERMPPVAEAYAALMPGMAALGNGQRPDIPAVETALLRALARAPQDPEILWLVAGFYHHLGAYEQSAEVRARGLAVDPLNTQFMIDQAQTLMALDRELEVNALLERVLQIQPQHSQAMALLAGIQNKQGAFAEAALWWSRAMEADPRDHEIPARLATHLLKFGLIEEALPWLRRAQLINPSGDLTLNAQMLYALATGEVDAAESTANGVLVARHQTRRDLYENAVAVYLVAMTASDRLDRAWDALEALAPGVVDRGEGRVMPSDDYALDIHWVSAAFQATELPAERRRALAEHLKQAAETVEPLLWEQRAADPYLAVVAGDRDVAITELVNQYNDLQALDQFWYLEQHLPVWQAVMNDPEVSAARTRRDTGLAEEAERYRAYVAAGDIVVP